ncbi:DUF1904 family protein [Spiroplasma alleghenense]|uniref:Uncharacterized protein n=1 Tax=Spiroplasma alleghenense TaxID=216931 RepID=A0A345Z263_9MOLU|nr:DUF1904 family protein [Spiroplasma alleghenense]AXK50692.1 hypothetical protein SALLE_v1c00160 [Spiroplasma alleghenense]
MPIFNFYGTSKEHVQNFANRIDEISEALKAPNSAFSFWNIDSDSIGQENLIKIEIKWKKRSEDMKSWIANFSQQFFSKINKDYQTIILFTEIDDNYYKTGIKS